MRLEKDGKEEKKEGRIDKGKKIKEMRHGEEEEKIRYEKYYQGEDRGKEREKT